jgi:hypothetical protein
MEHRVDISAGILREFFICYISQQTIDTEFLKMSVAVSADHFHPAPFFQQLPDDGGTEKAPSSGDENSIHYYLCTCC